MFEGFPDDMLQQTGEPLTTCTDAPRWLQARMSPGRLEVEKLKVLLFGVAGQPREI